MCVYTHQPHAMQYAKPPLTDFPHRIVQSRISKIPIYKSLILLCIWKYRTGTCLDYMQIKGVSKKFIEVYLRVCACACLCARLCACARPFRLILHHFFPPVQLLLASKIIVKMEVHVKTIYNGTCAYVLMDSKEDTVMRL